MTDSRKREKDLLLNVMPKDGWFAWSQSFVSPSLHSYSHLVIWPINQLKYYYYGYDPFPS